MAKTLTEQKLKKLIKKLKDAKKKKRKQKRDALISQRVTQKVIIGGGSGKPESNTGRSFPQIQFLPQPQIQNGDTQLLREIFLRNNLSPLTRPPISRVPNRPNYDLADQYGLNDNYNPYNSGLGTQPLDNQSDISVLSENGPEINSEFSSMFGNDSDTNSVLQPPPEKQGTLDTPIPNPKPNALAQTKITEFYEPDENPPIAVQKYMEKESDLFSKATEKLPEESEFVRPKRGRPIGSKNLKKTKEEETKEEDV